MLISNKELQVCIHTAKDITDQPNKNGVVIWDLKKHSIVSIGSTTFNSLIHATQQAIQNLSWWQRHFSTLILVMTMAPCLECARVIRRTPAIKEINYLSAHHLQGIIRLNREGVFVHRLVAT